MDFEIIMLVSLKMPVTGGKKVGIVLMSDDENT